MEFRIQQESSFSTLKRSYSDNGHNMIINANDHHVVALLQKLDYLTICSGMEMFVIGHNIVT